MRVWIDLANSPHVPLLAPVVRRLEELGHQVLITARDHAQTLELARRQFPAVEEVGGESPPGRLAKGAAITRRAETLRRLARRRSPAVAFSHGSYAQLLAARLAGVPTVTMMDYEHQPANHLSFRAATEVIVPAAFPERALRRFGARPHKVVRYAGFKEELYLERFRPDPGVLDRLELDANQVIAVMRPPPDGALYYRSANERFDELVRQAAERRGVQTVLLPRNHVQASRYRDNERIRIPERALDGASLLAAADLVIGAGGTMNREAALLGTPTYTIFAGALAAVDAELIRLGRMRDLRSEGAAPRFEKKPAGRPGGSAQHAEAIMEAIVGALTRVAP